jgi:hypothetical protein
MSISYLLNPETTINDLPLEILDKIKNMVLELQLQDDLQDHKKKFQHVVKAIPDVAKVLWSYCEYDNLYLYMPIKIFHDFIEWDYRRIIQTFNFLLLDVRTTLTYYDIQDMLTKSTKYHDLMKFIPIGLERNFV